MTEPDNSLRVFAGYSLKRAMGIVQADINAALARFDLRSVTFSALVVIVDNPGLKQSQLAQTLAIERPNLVVVLDELERRELILRERDTEDRRAYCLSATLAGRVLRDKAFAAVTEHEARMTLGLSDADRQTLIRALRRIEANGRKTDDTGILSRA